MKWNVYKIFIDIKAVLWYNKSETKKKRGTKKMMTHPWLYTFYRGKEKISVYSRLSVWAFQRKHKCYVVDLDEMGW